MKRGLLEILRCPVTGECLELSVAEEVDGDVITGELSARDASRRYPVRGSVPRFVREDDYTSSFGVQWNRFRQTQLDSVSGIPISHDRFYRYTAWKAEELVGRRILDVGCGAGRFSEIALDAGGRVVALDYSSAVDACFANLGSRTGLEVVQGDIYQLPFAPAQFDFVCCLGVLQHTPDARAAVLALSRQLKPGGKLVVDVYPRLLRNLFWSKYWLRPLTRRMNPVRLLAAVEKATPSLLAVSRAAGLVPVIGHYLRYLVPVANYYGVYPLSDAQVRQWAVLDTFDMLSPAHDHPQTRESLERWLREAGLENLDVRRIGFLVASGQKPRSASTNR